MWRLQRFFCTLGALPRFQEKSENKSLGALLWQLQMLTAAPGLVVAGIGTHSGLGAAAVTAAAGFQVNRLSWTCEGQEMGFLLPQVLQVFTCIT